MSVKIAIVPELRFPEFQADREWSSEKLSKLAKPVKKKAADLDPEDVLTLSGEHGLVRQTEYFGKKVAGEDLKRYIRIKLDDFVYNDRTTSAAKYGSLKRLTKYPLGAVSPIYKCFRLNPNEFPPYWERYFEAGMHDNALSEFINEGARAGRFNISVDTFLSISVRYPGPAEQQKIADCLGSLDDLIAAHSAKLDALQDHKKGLLQQLFPAEGETTPKLRFPEFEDAKEWEEHTLGAIAKFRRGSFPQPYGLPEWYDSENGMPFVQVFDVGENLRLKPKTKNRISELATKQSVFIPKGTVIITIQGSIGRVAITQYDAYIDRTLLLFESFKKPVENLFFAYSIQLLFEIERQKAPGGIIKTITKEVLSSFLLKLPSQPEQQKIANCLRNIDSIVTAQTEQIAALKECKKGLMQKLFPPTS